MQYTTNYNFKKPEATDTVNVNDFNDSFDLVDSTLKSVSDTNESLDTTFQQLVINAGTSNAEIVAARVKADNTAYATVGARMNGIDTQVASKASQTSLNETNATVALKADKSEVTNVMTPKGNIAYTSLPMTGNTVGWYYYCPDGDGTHGSGNYVWNGTAWYFGGTGDQGYNILKEDIDFKLQITQNILDLSNEKDGFINDAGTYQYQIAWHFYDTKVPVLKNSRYYRLVKSAYEQVVFYDINNGFKKVIMLYDTDEYFDTDADTAFVIFQSTKSQADYSAQVYSLIKPTQYVAGYQNKLNIPFELYSNGVSLKEYFEKVDSMPTNDKRIVVCWGDSLTQGANLQTPYTTKFSELLGSNYTVINRGRGGDTAEGIACRQGGLPIYLQPCTLSNTAYEKVNVTVKNIMGESIRPLFDSSNLGERVVINGKTYYFGGQGSLSELGVIPYQNGDGQTITRPYKLTFADSVSLKNKTMVIWSGSNNSPTLSNIDNVISKINAMINYNGNNNYIVVGMTSLTAMPDVLEINKRMALAFGDHFLDISEYLRTYGLEDAGITPTAQDIIDIANGDIPTSLRTDPVHLTTKANEIVANQIYIKGQGLGYW
jgi:lysophospholipase L1-like esterase